MKMLLETLLRHVCPAQKLDVGLTWLPHELPNGFRL